LSTQNEKTAAAAAVWEEPFHGEPAIRMRAGGYEAALLPGVGGNLISLRETERGYTLLHEPAPDEMDSFKARPFIHGIPVLFPPNRFEDGTFTLNGRTYRFPINETERNNHLHGFLHNILWDVTAAGAEGDSAFIEAACRIDESHPVYEHFPHKFTFRIRYSLDRNGLRQESSVTNEDGVPMPCMVAYHTAVNAPFVPGSTADDYEFTMTIGERWEMSERMLPTGSFQPLTEDEVKMKTTGVNPYFESMDNHYTAAPQANGNRAVLTDRRAGVRLVYDAGTAYDQWMIWNNGATPGFFCPEPQTQLVNAPNVALPPERTGLIMLEPGAVWTATSRLYVEPVE
jgi:aldose 1-epimerase